MSPKWRAKSTPAPAMPLMVAAASGEYPMSPPPAKLNEVGGGGVGGAAAGAFGTRLKARLTVRNAPVSVNVRIRPNFPVMLAPPSFGPKRRGTPQPLGTIDSLPNRTDPSQWPQRPRTVRLGCRFATPLGGWVQSCEQPMSSLGRFQDLLQPSVSVGGRRFPPRKAARPGVERRRPSRSTVRAS